MDHVVEAGVRLHARAVAQTWESCFQFICGEQLCRKTELERPLLISIKPSKRKTADVNLQEYKIEICHDLAEKIGLPLLRSQFGQSRVYPLNNCYRVRVRGCDGIIKFHQLYTAQLRLYHPDWANAFRWPSGKYN